MGGKACVVPFLPWVEMACLASFCRGGREMRAVVLPRAGDVRRAALLWRPRERRVRLRFGFVALDSPSVIGGYVWKLLAKQRLPIRRNRPVDEHISMRRKRRRKLFRCEEYVATCDKAACAPLLCRGGCEFERRIRDVPPRGARSCSLTPFPFLRAWK